MTDYRVQRTNMVDSQVRPNGITDQRIVAAMAAVARELFVAVERRAVAYADAGLPVKLASAAGPARSLMAPMALARLIQLAAVSPTGKVLHVGAATGYASAVLARLCASVVAVEEDFELAVAARTALEGLGLTNVAVHSGRHTAGRAADAPFDAILVDGRVPEIPQALLRQLKNHGRLVAATGDSPLARATVVTRQGDNFTARGVFDMDVPALPGFEVKRPAFVF
jgi:protein-L-isoaspartate(D-aspartate) O-methyltransferase